MNLNESIAKLIESEKYVRLTESDKMLMATLLEQTAANINENTMTQDIAQFTPIIMPLVRKVYPALIANEVLGVQPLKTPTGFIYALRNTYTGDMNNKINPHKLGQIVVFENEIAGKVGDKVTGATTTATGTIVHIENDRKTALVSIEGDKYLAAEDTTGVVGKIVAVYTNESTFGKILKDYTGSHTTHVGELLGKDIKEVGITIEKKAVEAKTRKLRGSYTHEMYEDLKNQHGLLADDELISLIRAELQTEIDREVINFVNNNATIVPNSFAPSAADGRWEIEKYRVETIKIAKECRQIGIDTKRGNGNIILCSPGVVTMLEQTGSFKSVPTAREGVVNGDAAFRGLVGTFDGKKVICDQYADSDYVTCLYKGEDRRDAMGFLSVYIPAEFQKVMDPYSGQPSIIVRTRYALDTQPLNPEAYARSFGVDLKGTVLA